MTLPIGEEVYRAFDLATLRSRVSGAYQSLRWNDEVIALARRCDKARAREELLYQQQYQTRVEQARRRLIDAAGSKTREFKPWWAAEDRFSPDDLLRQARRAVRTQHEQRMARIDEYERRRLRVFTDEPMLPEGPTRPRGPFSRATDCRRSGLTLVRRQD
jgi:hypothetical protein